MCCASARSKPTATLLCVGLEVPGAACCASLDEAAQRTARGALTRWWSRRRRQRPCCIGRRCRTRCSMPRCVVLLADARDRAMARRLTARARRAGRRRARRRRRADALRRALRMAVRRKRARARRAQGLCHRSGHRAAQPRAADGAHDATCWRCASASRRRWRCWCCASKAWPTAEARARRRGGQRAAAQGRGAPARRLARQRRGGRDRRRLLRRAAGLDRRRRATASAWRAKLAQCAAAPFSVAGQDWRWR